MTRSEMRKALKTRRRRSLSAVALVAGAVVASSAFVALSPAQAATAGCFETDLTAERWEDGRGVVMFATNADQAAEAAAAGFAPTGDSFALSSERQRGLVPLYDAFRDRTGNHAWMLWEHEYKNVVKAGWEGRGILGYVSPKPLADCTDQVTMTRGVKGALHTVETDAGALAAEGYRAEYSWYAPAETTEATPTPTPTPTATPEPTAEPTAAPSPEPTAEPDPEPTAAPTPEPTVAPEPEPEPVEPEPVPPVAGDGDGVFTIATYPDTQQEVFSWAGSRFLDRSKWLVSEADELDLRFVAHIGDVVNYVSDGYPQYVIAEAAFDPFEAAGIPYQLSIGNHDTMATGPGGGARDPKRTREYQRTTTAFNQFWKAADYGAVAGVYEDGKVDNTYSTFSAEGAQWLVLNLELWPRAGVVDWAEDVIASHPTHNVVIQTHSFLDAGGNIDGAGQSATRWSYGDSSPQYVYDRLVAPYANVKVVMSGHTGSAVSKTVTTANGNTVAYLLQAIHSNDNNPVRLSKFDVAAGTIDTEVYAPEDGSTWDTNVLSGLSFITG